MAYDEDLTVRIRDVLATESGVTEKKMFGGLGFMLDGAMAVAAGSERTMMVRVDPTDGADLVKSGNADLMEMNGRSMAGWLLVQPEAMKTKKQLTEWVTRSVAYARSLPPKPAKKKAAPKPSA